MKVTLALTEIPMKLDIKPYLVGDLSKIPRILSLEKDLELILRRLEELENSRPENRYENEEYARQLKSLRLKYRAYLKLVFVLLELESSLIIVGYE
jgi:hypothetical protein